MVTRVAYGIDWFWKMLGEWGVGRAHLEVCLSRVDGDREAVALGTKLGPSLAPCCGLLFCQELSVFALSCWVGWPCVYGCMYLYLCNPIHR